MMMRLKDSRHGTTKSAAQSSLMITTNEEDRTLGLRITKISIRNPDTAIRTTRHPIDKLASTLINRQYPQDGSRNSWTNGPNNRQQTQYSFNARQENSDTQYNKNFPQSNNLPTPNSVQFVDDYDTNMISDLSFCNQVRQQTSHSFRFEDSYDSLCYKFYLQDIEEQNLRLKTERIQPPVETYTEDIEPLIETRCRINCSEYES